MSRLRSLLSPRALGIGAVLLLGACASNAPQDTLEPEGPAARQIDNLVNPVFIIAAIVFVIVEVGVLLLAWRFRRRRADDDETLPAQVHGHTALELGWTILPALILTVVAVMTVSTIFELDNRREDAVMSVEVIGKQWWWEYRYDVDDDGEADIVTANDLVIPAEQPVELSVTSDDVVHSFWIPTLAGKKDAVPGRHHPLVLESDAPGTFIGECTEFCGDSHAYMNQRVVAMPEDEYVAWQDRQLEDATMPASGPAADGAELFTTMCSRCHLARGINDQEFEESGEGEGPQGLIAGPAPDLTHLMSRGVFAGGLFDLWLPEEEGAVTPSQSAIGGVVNTEDLKAWLRNAPGQKPMQPDDRRGMPQFDLTEDQVDDLYEFLITLD